MHLFSLIPLSLLLLIMQHVCDGKARKHKHFNSKNKKRWMESSYSQGYDPSHSYKGNLQTRTTEAVDSTAVSLGLSGMNDMEIKNEINEMNDDKLSTKQNDVGAADDSYSQELATYLKPGIGDYPSDMISDPFMKNTDYLQSNHKQQQHIEDRLEGVDLANNNKPSIQEHTNPATLLEEAVSTLTASLHNKPTADNTEPNENIGAEEQNISGGDEHSNGGATITPDPINQDEVSPAKVIDSALAKITNEASKLMKHENKEEHSSGSGEESHSNKDDLSDEEFILKLADANGENDSEDSKSKNKEKKKEKLKAKEDKNLKEESTTKDNAKTTNSSSETTDKTSSKLSKDEGEKSNNSLHKSSDKNEKGTRRENYELFDNGVSIDNDQSVGYPTTKYTSNFMDNDENFDDGNENEKTAALPHNMKAKLVSSLKEALLKNVEDIIDNEHADEGEGRNPNDDENKSHANPHSKPQSDAIIEKSEKEEKENEKEDKSEKVKEKSAEKDEGKKESKNEKVNGEHSAEKDKKESKGEKEKLEKEEKEKSLQDEKVKNNDEEEDKGGSIDSKLKIEEEAPIESSNKNEDEKKPKAEEKQETEESSSDEGDSDLLEQNLMKIDKKKLVHLLAKFMRDRKNKDKNSKSTKGGSVSDTEMSPHDSQSSNEESLPQQTNSEEGHYEHQHMQEHPILIQSQQNPNASPLIYFHSIPTVPIKLHSQPLKSLSQSQSPTSDPYANIGMRDPGDGDKPITTNHHETKNKVESTEEDSSNSLSKESDNKDGENNEKYEKNVLDEEKKMKNALEKEKEKLKMLRAEEKAEEAKLNAKIAADKLKQKESLSSSFSESSGEADTDHKEHHATVMQSDIVNAVADNIDQIMEKEKSLENPSSSSSGDNAEHTEQHHHNFKSSHTKNSEESSADSEESKDDNNDNNIQKLIHHIKQKLLSKTKNKKSGSKRIKDSYNDVYAEIGSSYGNPTLKKRMSRANIKKHNIHRISLRKLRHHKF